MPPGRMIVRWRLLVLAWVIPWITTVPLFHLHLPDTTDWWSALNSGGAHTVFTPDLPGEFARPLHNTHEGHSARLSPRLVNSPELGIAVFYERSENRKANTVSIVNALSQFLDLALPRRIFSASRAPPRSSVPPGGLRIK